MGTTPAQPTAPTNTMTRAEVEQQRKLIQDNFLAESTPQRMPVGTQQYVDGGSSRFILPQSGLASRLMLSITGQIVVGGNITGGTWRGWPNPVPFGLIKNVQLTSNQNVQLRNHSGWGWIKWLHYRYAFNPFGYIAPGNFSGASNALLGVGAPSILPNANVAAGTYNVNFTLPMPIAYNKRASAGLLVLQSNSVQYNFLLSWAAVTGGISAVGGSNDFFVGLTGTGLSVTANFTATLNIETFLIPKTAKPSVSMILVVNESVKSPLTSGDNTYQLPPNDLYTLLIMEMVNNAAPIAPTNINSARFVHSANVNRYNEDIGPKLGYDLWDHTLNCLDGCLVWDLGTRNGFNEQRDIYDAFNSTEVTDIRLIANLPATLPITGTNQMTITSEALRSVRQGY